MYSLNAIVTAYQQLIDITIANNVDYRHENYQLNGQFKGCSYNRCLALDFTPCLILPTEFLIMGLYDRLFDMFIKLNI